MKNLKYVRRVAAALFFAPILLYFLDFAGLLPNALHALLQLQWIPALMAVNLAVLAFLLVLSLLFGRLYCSVICPLGIFQDIAAWKSTWFRFPFKKKKKRYEYMKAQSKLRYSILAVTLVTFILGSSFFVINLDPYSIFGRITSQIFRPIFVAANNALVSPLESMNIHALYRIEQLRFVPIVFSLTFAFFIIVSVMAWVRGRLFCNTVCPVGTTLGLLSKFSLFHIRIEKSSCTQCSACEKQCKSQCIDSLKMEVDDSRCVTCFNCLSSCKKGGIRYAFRYSKKEKPSYTYAPENKNRRIFLLTSGAVMTGLATMKAQQINGKADPYLKRRPIMPPGAQSIEHFNQKCTGCQLCVSRCPMQVLRPASLQYGLTGIMQPYLDFGTHIYCNYECTICSTVCPTGALKPLTVEQKKVTQIGVAHFRKELCEVYVNETDCGACSEHCPTQAVKMIPYKDGLTIPEVTPELCIGCGGCESICPVQPYEAIYVEGSSKQLLAEKPKEAEKFEKKVEDFGF